MRAFFFQPKCFRPLFKRQGYVYTSTTHLQTLKSNKKNSLFCLSTETWLKMLLFYSRYKNSADTVVCTNVCMLERETWTKVNLVVLLRPCWYLNANVLKYFPFANPFYSVLDHRPAVAWSPSQRLCRLRAQLHAFRAAQSAREAANRRHSLGTSLQIRACDPSDACFANRSA